MGETYYKLIVDPYKDIVMIKDFISDMKWISVPVEKKNFKMVYIQKAEVR